MSVELRPLGVKCNLNCVYCYQQPERDAGNIALRYDVAAMKAAVKTEGGPFTLFGGEALLIPPADLESLFAFGLEEYGENTIQTNGALITDAHVALFHRYNVRVGISIDGPGELNDARAGGGLARTRSSTEATERAIARLCEEGIAPSLIVTLHRGNAAPDKLPRMHAWMKALSAIGVRSVRLHLLEVENQAVRDAYALTTDENIEAMRSFRALERQLPTLRFDKFSEMRRLLLGDDHSTTCVWNACDPLTTASVNGIEGFGQRSNCGRTNKDGIDFVKSSTVGFERYVMLHKVPQWAGGCRDCRFFMMCKGQCPGTAIDGDWRNRTEHCGVLKALFEDIETELVADGFQPLSLHPDRADFEGMLLRTWSKGSYAYLLDPVPVARPDENGWQSQMRSLRGEIKRSRSHVARPVS